MGSEGPGAIICVLTQEGTAVCRSLHEEAVTFTGFPGNFRKIIARHYEEYTVHGLNQEGELWEGQYQNPRNEGGKGRLKVDYSHRNKRFTDISSHGPQQLCKLHVDSRITCWNPTVRMSGPFTQIASGIDHVCALREDGETECKYGNNLTVRTTPEGPFTKITGSNETLCGLRPNGTITCWTWKKGHMSVNPNKFEVVNFTGHKYKDIGEPGCAITEEDRIDCWGPEKAHYYENELCSLHSNGAIECGTERGPGEEIPNPLLDVPEGTYKAVSTLFEHTACAIRTDNRVVCWGKLKGELEF